MKFWIDECLTPALVAHAYSHGYEATCTRDRGQLGMPDDELLALAVGEEFVFVTNNHADFVGLCANAELHTGLVVLPQRQRDAQLLLLSDAISHIDQRARGDPSRGNQIGSRQAHHTSQRPGSWPSPPR